MLKKLLFSLLLSTCLLSPVWAADKQQAAKVIDEAKSLLQEAIKLQGGWTSTQKMIKKAEDMLAKGHADKAFKLAGKARDEAKLSLRQAQEQNKNWAPPPYLQ